MPWVLMARYEKKTRKPHPDPMGDKYLDCGDCMERMPAASRAVWRCGWLHPSERREPGFKGAPPQWGHKPSDLCPGYLISLPQVCEAARAHWEVTQTNMDVAMTPLLRACINEVAAAQGAAEQDILNK